MERFFDQDGWLYRFLNRLWDLIVLNILFIITSIPLITIGASVSALYTVTIKGVRKEDSYIVRSYLKAFKENFKKATVIWIILLVFWIVLIADILIYGKNNSVMVCVGGIFGVFWMLVTMYVLPLQARFENSVQNMLLNSFLIAVKYWNYTLQLLGISVMVPAVLALLVLKSTDMLGWFCSLFVFVGFSGIAWIKSFLYRIVFEKVTDNEVEK